MNKLKENLKIIGKHFDNVQNDINWALDEVFPDRSIFLIEYHEQMYDIHKEGTIEERRNHVLTAVRARGGLSKTYFEALGNSLGFGRYTVSISEGSDAIGFRVATLSPNTVPKGPATIIPGLIVSGPFVDGPWNITVLVSGVAGPETDLEETYNRLKPSHTIWDYTYVP